MLLYIKKLPLGIQTFSKIIHENMLYVDKTREILELISNGSCYFLSRPKLYLLGIGGFKDKKIVVIAEKVHEPDY